MKHMLFTAFASSLLALGGAQAGQAALVHYTLSGDYNATFDIQLMPVPSSFTPGSSFTLDSVAGTFPGTVAPVALQFFTSTSVTLPGGFAITDAAAFAVVAPGAQLFDEPTDAPTMRLGTFTLDALRRNAEGQIVRVPNAYRLTAVLAPDVPEPASWALLMVGFGAAGAVLRARAHRTV